MTGLSIVSGNVVVVCI